MVTKAKKVKIKFHLPLITIFIAVLIPLVTLLYHYAPISLKQSYAVVFITSPFNIIYELGNMGLFWNYAVIVIAYFLIELYSRNLADIRGRDSLIDNAFLFGVLSAYISSLVIWAVVGVPSVGTSVLAFTIFIFFAFETMDSELIVRISEDQHVVTLASIAIFAFVAIVLAWSMIFFVYLNGNPSWWVHLLGGAIFAFMLFMYAKWLRLSVDTEEEKIREDVERMGRR